MIHTYLKKSHKLDNVLYDIRGPVLKEAVKLERVGEEILRLHIGNPAPFGFSASTEMVEELTRHIRTAQGYSESKGLPSAREAVAARCRRDGIRGVGVEDIYLGNGASELITLSMLALLNNGDEVLVPSPDYPLWTAAVSLAGGKPVHYRCDETEGWQPDVDDINRKITRNTRALVVINPNNPTGAVYPPAMQQRLADLACEHGLVLCSDEIYDRILYDGAEFASMASLCEETLCLTYNGVSKNCLAAGFRGGWMVISGDTSRAADYIEGIDLLANMRLCSNVPAQLAVRAAVASDEGINMLIAPGGRLYEQRETAYRMFNEIEGVSCVKPDGSFYLFPRLDAERFNLKDDEQFALDLLKAKHILTVHGSGFNCMDRHHFRIVFLPDVATLSRAATEMRDFLANYHQ